MITDGSKADNQIIRASKCPGIDTDEEVSSEISKIAPSHVVIVEGK